MTAESIQDRFGDVPVDYWVADDKSPFALIHLDSPTAATREERIEQFDPDGYYDVDCPLCQRDRVDRIAVYN